MPTFGYSHNFYPPAPVVSVKFVTAAEERSTDTLSALIDSGADGTIVPVEHLNNILAPTTREMFVRSQWGERHQVLLYLVDVQINGITLPGVEVIGDEIANEVVIGRNILNKLRVQLDGPDEQVKISA